MYVSVRQLLQCYYVIDGGQIINEVILSRPVCVNRNFALTAVIPVSSSLQNLSNLKLSLKLAHDNCIKVILVLDRSRYDNFTPSHDLDNEICKNCVVLVKGQYGGPGNARNAALGLIETEWVIFWDSDDIPNADQIMQSMTSRADMEVIIGTYSKCWLGQIREIPKINKNNNILQVIWNPGLWRMVIKLSVITEPFPPYRMGEDQIFILKNRLLNRKIFFDNKNFYNYFTNVPNQLTSQTHALNDLLCVLVETLLLSKNEKGKNKLINVLFSVRQFITIQKKCNWQVRFIASKIYLYYFLGLDLSKFEKVNIDEI